jgi:hypothetical protein
VCILDPNRAAAIALAAAVECQVPLPLATIEAQEDLEETKGKLLEVLDEPELRRRTPSPSPSLMKKGTPSRALLWSPPALKIPLGEFTIPRRPRRARPHQRRLVVAPGCLAGVAAVAPVPLLTGNVVSCPRLDLRPRLEREIPLRIFNLSHRSENRRLSFNESPWTPGPAAVDPVYGPWTYFTDFSIEK